MECVLKVRGLSKYFGRKKIVDGIDLDVYAGEVLGFLGPNGAGKTTAIKTVLGFLAADGGSIIIDGCDVKKNYERAMACVGGIVENPDMYKQFSGMMNLKMYARTHDNIDSARIHEVVRLVGLENRINDKVKKYSLGMKQRLGLAQAILHRPKLLILDEPTNGLDPAGIRELRDILKRLAHEEGAAVLVSSHQLAEMQLMCDRVAIISKGRILCEKTVEELGRNGAGYPTYTFCVDDAERAYGFVSSFISAAKAATEGAVNAANMDTAAENDGAADGDSGEKNEGPAASEFIHTGESVRLGEKIPDSIEICTERERVPEIVARLVAGNIGIYEIRKEESSLEDVFIEITGGGNSIA